MLSYWDGSRGSLIHCGVDVSKTGAWSSGLYKTRTGVDEAKQLYMQQVSKVYTPVKVAVRLEQYKDVDKVIKVPTSTNILVCR